MTALVTTTGTNTYFGKTAKPVEEAKTESFSESCNKNRRLPDYLCNYEMSVLASVDRRIFKSIILKWNIRAENQTKRLQKREA